MDKDKKKYTFDDWLNDVPFRKGVHYIDSDTFQKIKKAQTYASDCTIRERARDLFLWFSNNELLPAEHRNEALNLRIEELEKDIDTPRKKQLIYGPLMPLPIIGSDYKKVLYWEKHGDCFPKIWHLQSEEVKETLKAKADYKYLQKLKTLRNKISNDEPAPYPKNNGIQKTDIFFRFFELRDSGVSVSSAVEHTRDWLESNSIDPDNTKELFNITISNINPDSFRKTADNYYKDYLKQKRKKTE